ncbi:MAG TPA: hypothetical protein VHM48_03315 [Candidatus Limnocylindrales bacterium]|nr:hypothetical protein [Candidatus Limnocylindrales bacterium]
MTGRGLQGRHLARLLLLAAFALDLIPAFLFVSAPNFIGPMSAEPPSRLVWLIPAVGIALNLAGLAWMVRLYLSDSEARPSAFRFTHR